jgi:serralysin
MANVNKNSPGSGYGNPYLDSLIWGGKWGGGTIGYSFGSLSSVSNGVGYSWLSDEKTAFQQAVQIYANVCNVHFAEVAPAQADVIWWLADQTSFLGTSALALHEPPDGSVTEPIYAWFNISSTSWTQANMHQGGYGFGTITHELGHMLGLAHPHDGGTHADRTTFPGVRDGVDTDLGDYSLNQGIWTTMGYNSGWNVAPASSLAWGWEGTPMAFDIAALQKLYGANTSYHTGNDTYNLPKANGTGTFWSCIWDAGGSDTISAAGANSACTITLFGAPLTGENAGGFVSYIPGIIGGFTIANGVIIENATGGNAGDTLVGNGAANTLNGGAGNDTMSGANGNDTYVYTAGDLIVEGATGGTDLVQSKGNCTLGNNLENLTLTGSLNVNGTGTGLNNRLTGNAGNNILNSGTGNDTLDGAAGNDTMNGGADNDTYVWAAGDTISEAADGGIDLVLSKGNSTLGANLENLTLTGSLDVNGTGNGLNNRLTGNAGDNILNSGAGDDTLDGAAGNDTMNGGVGNDTYVIGIGDTISETEAGGTGGIDTVQSANSRTLGVNLENLTLTGTANISGTGNSLGNRLTGNGGNNTLNGAGGDDTLDGLGGNDTLIGGTGNDTYMLRSGDTVNETTPGAAGGTDTVLSSSSHTLGANLENLTLLGSANLNGVGNSLGNLLKGNGGNNVLSSLDGADTLVGGGGADTLLGGGGDDTLAIADTAFGRLDGGVGTDTLRLDGSGFAPSLTTLGARVAGIERIDMAGSGNHSLTLSGADVLDISDTDELIVLGDSGDQVTTAGTWTAGLQQTIDGQTYNVYSSGGATLLVDTDIVQNVDT